MTTQKTVNLSQYYVKKTDLATPGTDGTSANGATDGLMSGADKYKLNGISPSSTTPSADTTNGSYGSGTDYARANHTHPKSTLYAEASHDHGNLKSDGSVGTSNNASKNVVTDANGKITTEAKPTIPTRLEDLYLSEGESVTVSTGITLFEDNNAENVIYALGDTLLYDWSDTDELLKKDITSGNYYAVATVNDIPSTSGFATSSHGHGNISNTGTLTTTGTVDISDGDLLLFADHTDNVIKGSSFVDALNDLILDLITEGQS